MNRLAQFSPKVAGKNARAGFEIWFAVIINQQTNQAIWVRYTAFYPRENTGLQPKCLLWASFYDAQNPDNFCYNAVASDIESLSLEGYVFKFPGGSLTHDLLKGTIGTNRGELSWELNFDHKFAPLSYAPKILENLGIAKTKAVITSPFARVNGEVSLAGRKFPFTNAGGLITHIWGSNYIEELFWIFVPAFDLDLDGWALEIVSARPKAFMPQFTFVILAKQGKITSNNPFEAIISTLKYDFPEVEFSVKIKNYHLKVKCRLDMAQTTRYIYKNPDGSNRYIAHSDVGEVICQIAGGNYRKILTCKRTAAVEFHSVKAWDDKVYLDPLADKKKE